MRKHCKYQDSITAVTVFAGCVDASRLFAFDLRHQIGVVDPG